MKYVTLTLTHGVPHANFCTTLSGDKCRFCQDLKGNKHYCCLYDEPLVGTSDSIEKCRRCCKATAGFETTIEAQPEAPKIDPKALIKATIMLYNKNVKELIRQGYPRELAEKFAQQAVLGG